MKDNSNIKNELYKINYCKTVVFIDLRGILWYIYMDVNNYYFNFIYVYI